MLMGTVEFSLAPSTYQTATRDALTLREKNRCHPCTGSGTIPTSNGLILCVVPTEKELVKQLKDIGGLNKHYAAVTKEEADKFENLLPRPRPTMQEQEAKPFPIIWSYLSSAVSRNPRTTSRNSKAESSSPKSKSRNVKAVIHNAKAESLNSKTVSHNPAPVSIAHNADLENNIVSSNKTHCVHSGQQTKEGMFRLCSECQRISQLNSDRFPRYINEVACDRAIPSIMEQSVGCRRKQGMCIQRFLFMDFLVRTEKFVEIPSPNPDKFPKAYKQVWEPYTQKIRSCCECQTAVK